MDSCASCCLHCSCTSLFCLFRCNPALLDDAEDKAAVSYNVSTATLRCTTAIFCGRRAGWQHRVGHCSQRRPVGGVISKNWGFDLRTVSVPKVMISFIQRGRSQVPSCACPVADRALPEPGTERCGQRRRQPLGQNPSEPTWQADAEDAQRRLNGDFLEALVAM